MDNLTFTNDSKTMSVWLEYIKKMADYENRLDEVIATENSLKKLIFDKIQAEIIFTVIANGLKQGFDQRL